VGHRDESEGQVQVTSTDVARLAGVSQSTVSRTFSAPEKVAGETRERVRAVAGKLGYEPNAIARSLITQRTNFVGIVMADISSPFYPYVLEKFTERLQEADRHVLLFNAARDQNVDDLLPLALQYRVDALIITSATLSSEMADECMRRGTPVILFNRYVVGSSANAVSCDNVEGGRTAADLLLDAGHQRLAYVAGKANTSTSVDREKGFVEQIRQRGHREPVREQGNYTYESGLNAAKRLMSAAKPPDVIFCANDIMALGAVDAVRHELGLKVPEDVGIVGFDDIPAASWPSYSLTTIRQPVNQMIERTLHLLVERLESPGAEPVLELLNGRVIRRGSVAL